MTGLGERLLELLLVRVTVGGGVGLFSAVCMVEEEEEGGGKRVGLRW